MKKKLVAFLAAVSALVVCLCGFSACSGSPKTFTKEGMSIRLTTDFYEKELVSQTAYYESSSVIVMCLKEEYSSVPGFINYTLSEYTDLVLKANNLYSLTNTRAGYEGKEYMYFTYEKAVNGKTYYYVATTHKAYDSFWLIQFGCVASNKDKYYNRIFEWADTIGFGLRVET